jgi:hypothetical protein
LSESRQDKREQRNTKAKGKGKVECSAIGIYAKNCSSAQITNPRWAKKSSRGPLNQLSVTVPAVLRRAIQAKISSGHFFGQTWVSQPYQ